MTKVGQSVYRSIYRSPIPYLVLSPDLQIVNGNDAFVSVSRISRDVFAGRYMFDAFPGNTEAENTGVRNLMASFERVLATKGADTLKTQRYDVQNSHGIWETRHWDGTSWAVLGNKGLVTAVVLQVVEIVKTNEVRKLVNEANDQLLASRTLAEKIEELTRSIEKGRLDQLDLLRELLREEKRTIH